MHRSRGLSSLLLRSDRRHVQAIGALRGEPQSEHIQELQANLARMLAEALMFYTASIDAPGDVSQPAAGQRPPPLDVDVAGLPMVLHQLLVQHVLPLLPVMMESGSMPLFAQKIMASLLMRCAPCGTALAEACASHQAALHDACAAAAASAARRLAGVPRTWPTWTARDLFRASSSSCLSTRQTTTSTTSASAASS